MDRFQWAADIMNIQPHHHVLEVGCGVGLAVEQIVPCTITAIDRSKPMIEKAIKRNGNKAEFITQDLLDLSTGTYDIIFSFNINFFWTKKTIAKEMAIIKNHLSKKGRLYIFYGPLFGAGFEKMNKPVHQNLAAENFSVREVIHNKSLRCCCFVALPD
jgi:cyclopropane fatty-acyl-phospholipid synthase-like methyltransferase